MQPPVEQSRTVIGQSRPVWRTPTSSVYSGGMRLLPIVACGALAMAACGSDPPETLTCAWLAGPDNCWANTALTATTCLPPDTDTGLISADNATCSYATGEVVTFTPPIVLPTSDNMTWNFSINDANGQLCFRYVDNGNSLVMSVGSQTVTEGSSGGLGIKITCPDGTSVQTKNALNLLSCPDTGFLGLPGLAWSSSDTFVSTTLTGTGSTTLSLFDCSKT